MSLVSWLARCTSVATGNQTTPIPVAMDAAKRPPTPPVRFSKSKRSWLLCVPYLKALHSSGCSIQQPSPPVSSSTWDSHHHESARNDSQTQQNQVRVWHSCCLPLHAAPPHSFEPVAANEGTATALRTCSDHIYEGQQPEAKKQTCSCARLAVAEARMPRPSPDLPAGYRTQTQSHIFTARPITQVSCS